MKNYADHKHDVVLGKKGELVSMHGEKRKYSRCLADYHWLSSNLLEAYVYVLYIQYRYLYTVQCTVPV
jgi:hypothetical protein